MNIKTFSVVTTALTLFSATVFADGDRYGMSREDSAYYANSRLAPSQITTLNQAVGRFDRDDFQLNPKLKLFGNAVFQYLKSGEISDADALATSISGLIFDGDADTYNKTNRLIGEISTRLDEKEKGLALLQDLSTFWRENQFVISAENHKKHGEKKTYAVAYSVSGGMIGTTAGLFVIGLVAVFVPPAAAAMGTAALYGAGGGVLVGGASALFSPETTAFVSPSVANKKWFPAQYAQACREGLPAAVAVVYSKAR